MPDHILEITTTADNQGPNGPLKYPEFPTTEVDRLRVDNAFYRQMVSGLEKKAEDRDAIAEQLNRIVKVAGKLAQEAGSYRTCADLLELLMAHPQDLLAERDARIRAEVIEELS